MAEIRPVFAWGGRGESGLKAKVESASQDLVALFLVADEQIERDGNLRVPETPVGETRIIAPPMTERDRRWRERWRGTEG